MKDDPNSFNPSRRNMDDEKSKWKMENDLPFLRMENNLNFMDLEDDLNIHVIGRQPLIIFK